MTKPLEIDAEVTPASGGIFNTLTSWSLRLAASGLLPARWFEPGLPLPAQRAQREGFLHLEVVSHCWQYAHLLAFQLSSLIRHPPRRLALTMTVYYCPEDSGTSELLAQVGKLAIAGITWNWQPLPRTLLFRRAIGRNHAALNTRADWIWFTDCDLMFRDDCLDVLAEELQGSTDTLVFPASEYCTPLLADDDPLLKKNSRHTLPLDDIDPSLFTQRQRSRATGPLQITHGDVARACGYCKALAHYQRPARQWCKAYEDRAFRWLLRTQGTPRDIPGVYRIRHASKGRYTGNPMINWCRGLLRRMVSGFQEWRAR